MMKIKTQSPVYVNKKEVSNHDFYLGEDGGISAGPYAPGYQPGPYAPNQSVKPLSNQPSKAKPGSAKGGKLGNLMNRGILSDTLGNIGKNLKTQPKKVPGSGNNTTIITEKEKDKQPMSAGTKWAIAGGVTLLVVGVIWYARRKK